MRDQDQPTEQPIDALARVREELSQIKQQQQLELRQTEMRLKKIQDELEILVTERTAELVSANKALHAEIAERERAEKALRVSEARYRAILEDQTELVSRFLQDGTLTFVNEAYCSYFSESREELIGHKFWHHLPKRDQERFKQHLSKMGNENPVAAIEHEVLLPHGEARWVQWTDRAILNEEGQVVELQAVGRDITEQKRANQALQHSEHFLKTIIASVHEGVIVYDREFRYLLWNRFMESLTGMPKEAVLGKNALDLFPHLRDERVLQLLERAKQGETVFSGDIRYVVEANGKSGWVTATYSPHRDITGEIAGVVAIVHDITERKRVEEEIYKRAQIIDQTHDSVISTDLDGCIKSWNQGAERLYGYGAEEVLGRHVALIYAAEQGGPFLQENVLNPLKEKGSHTVEVKVRKKSGEIRDVLLSLAMIKNERGEPVEMAGYGTDITERKKSEEAIRKSREELRYLSSRLLSAQEEERKRIAAELHDSIGQTLVTLKVGLRNALKDMSKGKMQDASDLLMQLIPEIRKAIEETRSICTGLRPTVLDNLGIIPTIHWLTEILREVHPDRNIRVEMDIEEGDVPETIKIIIFRIIQEALNNVAKHSRATLVDLALSKKSGRIYLNVRDNGIGFDMAAGSKDVKSFGMGLASIKERAELSGGAFSIESAVSAGTKILVSWPARD